MCVLEMSQRSVVRAHRRGQEVLVGLHDEQKVCPEVYRWGGKGLHVLCSGKEHYGCMIMIVGDLRIPGVYLWGH